ncbi:hypothetical protein LEMLEM_LOCUS2242 [Lemmus lemmus]
MMPAGGGAAPSAKPELSSLPAGRRVAPRLPGLSTAACRSRPSHGPARDRSAPGGPGQPHGAVSGSACWPRPDCHVTSLALPPRRRSERRVLPALGLSRGAGREGGGGGAHL